METRTITLYGDDGAPVPAREAVPSALARAAVIVLGDGSVVDRVAGAGYHAVGLELALDVVSDATLLTAVDAALARLLVKPERIGVVGFGHGARASFLVAAEKWLGAAVGWSGEGIVAARGAHHPALAGRAYAMQTPWLGLVVDDPGDALAHALLEAPVDAAVVRPVDEVDAWERTFDWFERFLL